MKVLLGIGGSSDSFRALDTTLERACTAGDELTIAVLDNPESDRAATEVTDLVRQAVEGARIDAEIRRIDGDPGSRLIEIAEAEGFDRIVLGGGEPSPMGKINLGNISEFVLLNSRVTVTLVR